MHLLALILMATTAMADQRANSYSTDPEVNELIQKLRTTSKNVYEVEDAIRRKGKAAYPALLKLLDGNNINMFYKGANLIARQRFPGGTEVLIQRLVHAKQQANQHNMLWVLGNDGDPRSLPYIVPFTKSKDSGVRFSAIQALAYIGNPNAIPVLERCTRDRNDSVRWQAKDSIFQIRELQRKYPHRLGLFNGKLDTKIIKKKPAGEPDWTERLRGASRLLPPTTPSR